MEVVFEVEHMSCADCAERLQQCLRRDASVESAFVALMAGTARLKLLPGEGESCLPRLATHGTALGFGMRLRAQGTVLQLRTGAPCAASVAKAAGAIAGVKRATQAGRCGVDVAYDSSCVGARHILGTLRAGAQRGDPGCSIEPRLHAAADGEEGEDDNGRTCCRRRLCCDGGCGGSSRRLAVAVALAAAAVVLEYLVPRDDARTAPYDAPISAPLLSGRVLGAWICATVSMALYLPPLVSSAYGAARASCALTMDTLVSISVLVAYFFAVGLLVAGWAGVDAVAGFGAPPFEAPGILLPLVTLARELDQRARGLTQVAIARLAALQRVDACIEEAAPCAAAAAAAADGGAAPSPPCVHCAVGSSAAAPPSLSSLPASSSSSSFLSAAASSSTFPPALLHLGDVLRVDGGQLFPADGVLVGAGATSADESLVTGESEPVLKGPGSSVIGGTANAGGGSVRVLVLSLPTQGTVSKILALIASAAETRPRAQETANAIAAWFTPFVLAAALATLAAWWSAAAAGAVADTRGLAPAPFALQFALSLLVVSCPCVVALAVAPVMAAAVVVAARRGLLVKGGGACLESAARARRIVYDKTGTLSLGGGAPRRGVEVRVSPAAAASPGGALLQEALLGVGFLKLPKLPAGCRDRPAAHLLTVAAAVAAGSTHPLAASICRAAAGAGAEEAGFGGPLPSPPPVSCIEEERTSVPGKGILLAPRGGGGESSSSFALGSPEWLESERGVKGALAAAGPLRAKGLSTVAFALGEDLLGVFGVADTLRPGAREAVAAATAAGLEVYIASGDNPRAVLAAALQLGVPLERAFGGLSPSGKVDLVKRLQQQPVPGGGSGGVGVIFVGDGINDAAALAAADVGIALGAGAAVSMDAADVVIKESNLSAVGAFLSLARRARSHIRLNFLWAAVYNAVAMPLAAGALYPAFHVVAIPPGFSGLSELLSSVPVVLGSLAMYCWSPSESTVAAPLGADASVVETTDETRALVDAAITAAAGAAAKSETVVDVAPKNVPPKKHQVELTELMSQTNSSMVSITAAAADNEPKPDEKTPLLYVGRGRALG